MSKETLLSPAQLAVHRASCDDIDRPQLNNVHVDQHGTTTATDGHLMVRVKRVMPPTEAYPVPEGWDAPEIPKQGMLIPAATARAALKAIPPVKDVSNLVLRNALIDSVNGRVALSTSDGSSVCRMEADAPAGLFPDVDAVIPRGVPDLVIGFNPALMKRLCECLIACGHGAHTARFEFHGALGPCRVTVEAGDVAVEAVIMPLRLPETEGK